MRAFLLFLALSLNVRFNIAARPWTKSNKTKIVNSTFIFKKMKAKRVDSKKIETPSKIDQSLISSKSSKSRVSTLISSKSRVVNIYQKALFLNEMNEIGKHTEIKIVAHVESRPVTICYPFNQLPHDFTLKMSSFIPKVFDNFTGPCSNDTAAHKLGDYLEQLSSPPGCPVSLLLTTSPVPYGVGSSISSWIKVNLID